MLRRWSIVVRRICLLIGLLIAIGSIGIRARTYLLTRKIQAVLAGLERVQVDKTSEAELLKTVPYLVLIPPSGATSNRSYRVQIMNSTDRGYYEWTRWVPQFLWALGRGESGGLVVDKWKSLGFLPKVANVLGWRYLSFSASVVVLNSTVSGISYELDPDVFLGWPASNFVVARSMHGFWKDRGRPIPVRSAEDENPAFRFGPFSGQFSFFSARDSSIGVAYTPDASRELVSHVFRLDLSCFWGLRGCDSVQQVVPLLWRDRIEIEDAAAARLFSKGPCPDRILSGRVRTLLDIDIAVLELEDSRLVEFHNEGDLEDETVMDFRLAERIRGEPQGPWTNFRFRKKIPSPKDANAEAWNFIGWLNPKPGERFLYFSGARFDSCRIVPATPSAEAAVRDAIPGQQRDEDQISNWIYARQ
jgi:hypothetical protein